MSQFIDEATITFESGSGGNGSASFYREKGMPHGGPQGADGGRGGDVVLIADPHIRTLFDLRLKRNYKAANGEKAVNDKTGKSATSLRIPVPVGTVVIDNETDQPLVDLNVPGMEYHRPGFSKCS